MEIVIPAWPIIAKIYDFVLDNTQTNNAHTNINKYNVISVNNFKIHVTQQQWNEYCPCATSTNWNIKLVMWIFF